MVQDRLPGKTIYHSPHLYKSPHFPNMDGKSSKHSKDPRNCPVVLFFDSTHFVLISFLLRDPIMVVLVSNSQRSIENLSAMLGVNKKSNDIHMTFRRVVHDYVFKIVNIVQNKQKDEIKESFPEGSGTELRLMRPGTDKRRKLPDIIKRFYNNNQVSEEDRQKEIVRRNAQVTFNSGKMSKYLFSLIITKITP